MKFYATKYAMSGGKIELIETEAASVPGLVRYHPAGSCPQYFRVGRDCFVTEAEAFAQFEAQRSKKIASLEKQIKKLKAMKPEVVE